MTDAHEHGHELVALRARKAALRSLVLQRREGLDPATRQAASRRIVDAVLARAAFRDAHSVTAYASFGSEVDTSVLCETVLREGKMLLLPRVDKTRDAIRVYEVRDLGRDLDTNRWGIREPRPETCREIDPGGLEFVFVPAVALDERGGRLGYGKAYYDRLLAASTQAGGSPTLVAGAFAVQVVDQVPMEPHDVRIPSIVTEHGTLLDSRH
jgi:5,10-methenyltetrahydrofolate synthetase